MKSVIYYFTGTGNSLAAARRIAATLGDCELIPIASLRNTERTVAPEAERPGIVCPVEAIQLKVMRGTEGRGRYRHPNLKVADMEAQAGAANPQLVRHAQTIMRSGPYRWGRLQNARGETA